MVGEHFCRALLSMYAGRQLEAEKQARLCEGLPWDFSMLDMGVDLGRLRPVKGT